MAFEHPDMSGSAWKNKYKEGPADKKPDFTGKGKFFGKMMEISIWKNKKDDTGEVYLGVKLREPQDKQAEPVSATVSSDVEDDFDF